MAQKLSMILLPPLQTTDLQWMWITCQQKNTWNQSYCQSYRRRLSQSKRHGLKNLSTSSPSILLTIIRIAIISCSWSKKFKKSTNGLKLQFWLRGYFTTKFWKRRYFTTRFWKRGYFTTKIWNFTWKHTKKGVLRGPT